MPGPKQPALTPAIASKSHPVIPSVPSKSCPVTASVSTKSPLAPSSAAPAATSATAAATSATAAAASAGPQQPGAQQADSVSLTAEEEGDEDLSMPVSDNLSSFCAIMYVKRQVAFRLLAAHAVDLSCLRLLLGAEAPSTL